MRLVGGDSPALILFENSLQRLQVVFSMPRCHDAKSVACCMRSLRLKGRLRSSAESHPANEELVDYESPPKRDVLTPSYQVGSTLNCGHSSPTVKKASKIRAIASPSVHELGENHSEVY